MRKGTRVHRALSKQSSQGFIGIALRYQFEQQEPAAVDPEPSFRGASDEEVVAFIRERRKWHSELCETLDNDSTTMVLDRGTYDLVGRPDRIVRCLGSRNDLIIAFDWKETTGELHDVHRRATATAYAALIFEKYQPGAVKFVFVACTDGVLQDGELPYNFTLDSLSRFYMPQVDREINEFFARGNQDQRFEAKTGNRCRSCACRSSCPEGQQYVREHPRVLS